MLLRISTNLLLLFSVLSLPWWFTALLVVAGMFLFDKFFEAILWMLLADVLYGTPVAAWYDINILLSTGALIALLGIEFLKKELRFYSA